MRISKLPNMETNKIIPKMVKKFPPKRRKIGRTRTIVEAPITFMESGCQGIAVPWNKACKKYTTTAKAAITAMALGDFVVALPLLPSGWVEEGVGSVVIDELLFLSVELEVGVEVLGDGAESEDLGEFCADAKG